MSSDETGVETATQIPNLRPMPKTRLSDTQLGQVMRLLEDVDSVELKLTVPANSHRTTVRGLAIDPVEAEPRQVYFFDTPDLAANKAGIVVRARRTPGGRADTTVKLRPVVPSDLPQSLRRSGACKVELDLLPGGFVCSASLKGRATGEEVHALVNDGRSLTKLLSKEQRAFFRKHAPSGLTLDLLVPLGPTFVLKTGFFVKKLDRKVTAEMWLYPDGSRILELSLKAAPEEAFDVANEFRAYLVRKGIDTHGVQETKTATALQFFTSRLESQSEA